MSLKFYQSGLGDRLVAASSYPLSIVQFLEAEAGLLNLARPHIDTLVEVGCMSGRHVEWAASNGKTYIGVEPVKRYAADARRNIRGRGLDRSAFQILEAMPDRLHLAVAPLLAL